MALRIQVTSRAHLIRGHDGNEVSVAEFCLLRLAMRCAVVTVTLAAVSPFSEFLAFSGPAAL
jgi:hypothetical protein